MARANRHFIPGYNWHITHRCHNRKFLFQFSRDRDRWLQLLFEARKRYHLSILNYIVTSNHIHLIVSDNDHRDAIPKSLQYTAGRIGKEYNKRKNRNGAFWQDRYHATAIESGDHLWKCLAYVDLNMVRAGVVDRPDQWRWSGYNELQHPKSRYRLIDHDRLLQLLHVNTHERFAKIHRQYVDSKLTNMPTRQEHFSQSIAVGSKAYIAQVKNDLGSLTKGRKTALCPDGSYQLRETLAGYGNVSAGIERGCREERDYGNTIPWYNRFISEQQSNRHQRHGNHRYP